MSGTPDCLDENLKRLTLESDLARKRDLKEAANPPGVISQDDSEYISLGQDEDLQKEMNKYALELREYFRNLSRQQERDFMKGFKYGDKDVYWRVAAMLASDIQFSEKVRRKMEMYVKYGDTGSGSIESYCFMKAISAKDDKDRKILAPYIDRASSKHHLFYSFMVENGPCLSPLSLESILSGSIDETLGRIRGDLYEKYRKFVRENGGGKKEILNHWIYYDGFAAYYRSLS